MNGATSTLCTFADQSVCVSMETPAQISGSPMDAEQQNVPSVTFKLQFGKTCTDISMPLSATVGDLKQQAHELLGIPPEMQKLLIKGSMKPDTTSLQTAGIKKGLRVMLIGSKCVSWLILCQALLDISPALPVTGHRIFF